MPPASRSARNEVSTVLWWERDLLDGLAFTLEVQGMVLLPGRVRWLPRACREVEQSLGRLRLAEVERAVRVDSLARELGLQPAPSLRLVVDTVEEPWKEIFSGHLHALRKMTGEVRRLAAQNRVQLRGAAASPLPAGGWLGPGAPARGSDLEVRTAMPYFDGGC